jgi:hypothetical protein
MPGVDLYEPCPSCSQGRNLWPGRPVCPDCKGRKFTRIGLTIGQADAMVARERVRREAQLSGSDEPRSVCLGHGLKLGVTHHTCCDRAGEYNGFGSDGPLLFECPKHCSCHD